MPTWAKAAMIAIPLLVGSFWIGKGLYINQLSPTEAFQKGQQYFNNYDYTAAIPYLKRGAETSTPVSKDNFTPTAIKEGQLSTSAQTDCYYALAKSYIELKQTTDACKWIEEGLQKSPSNALMELCVYNKCNCTVNSSIPKTKTSN
jgi:tetratricopeptide (TPR) repeat protein